MDPEEDRLLLTQWNIEAFCTKNPIPTRRISLLLKKGPENARKTVRTKAWRAETLMGRVQGKIFLALWMAFSNAELSQSSLRIEKYLS